MPPAAASSANARNGSSFFMRRVHSISARRALCYPAPVTRVCLALLGALGAALASGVPPAFAAGATVEKKAKVSADKPSRPSDEPPPQSCLDRSITDELGE